jgi:hypothetical protein
MLLYPLLYAEHVHAPHIAKTGTAKEEMPARQRKRLQSRMKPAVMLLQLVLLLLTSISRMRESCVVALKAEECCSGGPG